jgi:excisionase family DNA binding protein
VGRLNSNRSERRRLTLVAPRFLTVRELAKYLRVHPSTVYRLLKAQQLPGFRVGTEWRFSIEQINRWRRGEEQRNCPEARARAQTLRLKA